MGFPKWPPAANLNKISNQKSCVLIWNGEKLLKITFDRISRHFRSIRNVFLNSQNGCRRPFWMIENRIRKRFSIIQNGRRQPFCEFKKTLCIDLKWREMRSKVIFSNPKWWNKKVASWSEMARYAIKSNFRSSKLAAGSHFVKKKVAYWSEMVRNAIESDFRSSKLAAGSHFVKKKDLMPYQT